MFCILHAVASFLFIFQILCINLHIGLMSQNPALNEVSQPGSSDKVPEPIQPSSDVDFIKRSFEQINLDASDKNFSSSCLNETLCVYTLLASVGLESYMDLFAAQNMELEEFLDLTYIDLQLLGIQDSRHRNLIMELVNAFRFE